MARRTLLTIYIATYLLVVGTAIRYLVNVPYDRLWSVSLWIGYLILLFSEPIFIRWSRFFTVFYLLAQIAIICALSFIAPDVDYWAALFFPLVLHVMQNFPQRAGFLITGVFTVVMAILMLLGFGPAVGLPLIFINGVIYFLLAAVIAIIREAETSNEELRRQQLKLQAAHRELQSYTTQAEELAVLQERNRLARELHDSVTQSLFSLTLFTQAARERAEVGDLDPVKQSLARIADTARRSLKEMRLLVYELRPLALEDEGLVGALQQRLESVEGRSGVRTRLLVEPQGEVELPADVERQLYRVAEEALNNALKHADASSVTVRLAVTPSLALRGGPVEPCGEPVEPLGQRPGGRHLELEVSDDGTGFDPLAEGDKGGLGLTSIRERVEGMGGELTIISSPGEGTTLRVDVDLGDTEKTL